MARDRVIIIGGGLAGLSAGCYARASGFRTTIIEHNLALGGVCTAWSRGPYTMDGCIHWLTGGPFNSVYRELGILQRVPVHVLQQFAVYRDAKSGASVEISQDLEAFASTFERLAPEDASEIRRLVEGAAKFAEMVPPIDHPQELMTVRDTLRNFWEMRDQLSTLVHFRKPLGAYCENQLRSHLAKRVLHSMVPPEVPTFFLLLILGYLSRGWLSRPNGGTARFRDAVIDSYHALGGDEHLHATVEEVLVEGDRACGVRLTDGTMLEADHVISTASAPETVLRLLGGRYGADDLRKRVATWKMFDGIVLASYGVAAPLEDVPPTLLIDGITPLEVGSVKNDRLYLRIYNDDPSFAPTGHTVVQTMLTTSYDWWAKRGSSYTAAKDDVGERIRIAIEEHLPAMKGKVQVTDIATPLTYWNMARSWRGAFEGWMPSPDAFFGHIKKTLPGLGNFLMAGQWVEPGGGVPTALLSGRQVVQLLCANDSRPFHTPMRG